MRSRPDPRTPARPAPRPTTATGRDAARAPARSAHRARRILIVAPVACIWAACFGAAGPAACSSQNALSLSPGLFAEASTASAPGDWDDIDAAVEAALERAEVAVVSTAAGPDRKVYELVTIEGRPGQLTIRRNNEDGSTLRLSASIGRFGEPARERRLLRAVADRLRQLRGVDVAPIG